MNSWKAKNRRRGELIEKEVSGTLREDERLELEKLQHEADEHQARVAPREVTTDLDDMERAIWAAAFVTHCQYIGRAYRHKTEIPWDYADCVVAAYRAERERREGEHGKLA